MRQWGPVGRQARPVIPAPAQRRGGALGEQGVATSRPATKAWNNLTWVWERTHSGFWPRVADEFSSKTLHKWPSHAKIVRCTDATARQCDAAVVPRRAVPLDNVLPRRR